MNLVFHSTETFEQNLQQFDACWQEKIVQRVNEVVQAFIEDQQGFALQARKPYKLKLRNGGGADARATITGTHNP